MKFIEVNEGFTFDDVLLVPQFSKVASRADVNLDSTFCGLDIKLPVISANMRSVFNPGFHLEMAKRGALTSMHRFSSIEDSINDFHQSYLESKVMPFISVGIGKLEIERAEALVNAGATHLILDVAHGASLNAAKQVTELRKLLGKNVFIIVGNFANGSSIQDFFYHEDRVDGVKVGIGPGAACQTRTVTGHGFPQLSAIQNVRSLFPNMPLIADGGVNQVGDIAKAIAAGANIVMAGKMFASTIESNATTTREPGTVEDFDEYDPGKILVPYSSEGHFNWETEMVRIVEPASYTKVYKEYSGSASIESYKQQGKLATWRAPEGGTFKVRCSGSVHQVLNEIEGGLRSALSYSDAHTLKEFRENALFIKVTSSTVAENGLRK